MEKNTITILKQAQQMEDDINFVKTSFLKMKLPLEYKQKQIHNTYCNNNSKIEQLQKKTEELIVLLNQDTEKLYQLQEDTNSQKYMIQSKEVEQTMNKLNNDNYKQLLRCKDVSQVEIIEPGKFIGNDELKSRIEKMLNYKRVRHIQQYTVSKILKNDYPSQLQMFRQALIEQEQMKDKDFFCTALKEREEMEQIRTSIKQVEMANFSLKIVIDDLKDQKFQMQNQISKYQKVKEERMQAIQQLKCLIQSMTELKQVFQKEQRIGSRFYSLNYILSLAARQIDQNHVNQE